MHPFDEMQGYEPPRKIRLMKKQWIMIPFLAAIPVLALTRALGDAVETTRSSASGLEVSVTYPSRLRFGQSEELQVDLRNASGGPALRDVKVEIAEGYLSGFEDVQFNPSNSASSNRVELLSLEPGEKRSVRVSLKAKNYGTHEGEVKVLGKGSELASARIQSLVFP